MPKTVILVGLTGSGKSTTGNCLFNKSALLEKISNSPFPTSDSSSGCTQHFSCCSDHLVKILDTVGFGDPKLGQNFILNEFKKGLHFVNDEADIVVFVIRKGRFSNQDVDFFEFIQEHVFKNKFTSNSILVVTNCSKGWLDEPLQKYNSALQKVLKNCNNVGYEFSLNFDKDDDDSTDRSRNFQKRQNSIDAFVNFIDNLKFKRVNLNSLSPQEQLASILSSSSIHSQNPTVNLLAKQIEDAKREAEKTRIQNELRLEQERKRQEEETLRLRLEAQRRAESIRILNELRLEEERRRQEEETFRLRQEAAAREATARLLAQQPVFVENDDSFCIIS